MFKGYYRRRFNEILGVRLLPTDGFSEEKIAAAIGRTGVLIPRALRDYHAVAGRHPNNTKYNRLLPIAKLAIRDGKLVFMEEHQWVAIWGVDAAAGESNPIVWQAPNTEPLKWQAEPYRLVQFIMAMWRWQETGEQEPPET